MGAASSVPQKSLHDFTVKDSKGNLVNLNIYEGKVLLVVNVASKCGFTNSNYTQLTELYTKYKDKGLEILAFPCNQFMNQEPGSTQEAEQFACTRFKAEYPIFQKAKDSSCARILADKVVNRERIKHLLICDADWNILELIQFEMEPVDTIRFHAQLRVILGHFHLLALPKWGCKPMDHATLVVPVIASNQVHAHFLLQVKVNGPDTAPVYKFLKASKGGYCGSSIKWNFTKFLVDKHGHVIKRYGTTTSPLAIEGDIRKALGES
ncbi:UNVERIFIED_CONTAM: putative glutathione peroxidase 5 [Sesamum latifolium]|uniref:Glutathione peroxidase n=1 Tax=Sesamum latifolium TaxID=2727402 RepID=A0AAW2Y1F2_9LAMI